MPASFRFDPLIKIRENLRDQRRRELTQAEADADFERLRLAEAEKALEKNLADWNAAADESSPSVETLALLQRNRDRLRRIRPEIADNTARLDKEVEQRRTAFDEAVRDVRVLDQLRERRRNEESADEKKTEQKELDEMGRRKK